MKVIVTEDQYKTLFLRRRIPEIKEVIRNTNPYMYPCDYENFFEFLQATYEESMLALPDNFFTDDAQTTIQKIFDGIGKELSDHWYQSCKN